MMTSMSANKICRVAILIACFNRRLTTLKSLDAIKAQKDLRKFQPQIYLTE